MSGKRLLVIVGIAAIFLAGGATLTLAKVGKKEGQSKTLRVKAGKEFVITLGSNITTGYQWQLSKAVDRQYLLLVGLRYVTKKPGLAGSGGREEWIFKAVKPGTAIISFEYVRPWEKGAAAAKARNFVIIIK